MQKQRDILQDYVSLRQQLQQERDRLKAQLLEIDRVLTEVQSSVPSVPMPTGIPGSSTRRAARGGRRVANTMSLREAIQNATSRRPLGVREIVEAVQKQGYRFQSSNPTNSVGAYLYGPEGKKHFKRVDGGFAPAGGSASVRGARDGNGKPAKGRRTMSAEGRKRISEAARRMWAERKKAKK